MKDEQALSEVIGFLMIVALMGTLFSMYLLYVVPIQGKDAEITHMKYVTQQFIDVKSDIDALIINERVNVPIARSFELGTLSSSGQGALSIMPIQSFIEAAGTLVVNEQMDTITIHGKFRTYNESSYFSNIFEPAKTDWFQIFNDREHLYVYYPGIDSPTNSTIVGNITFTEGNGTFRIRPENKYFINYTDTPDPTTIWYVNSTNNPDNTKNLTVHLQRDVILEIFNGTSDYGKFQYQKTLLENATAGPHLFDLYDGNEITWANSSFLNYTHSMGVNSGNKIDSKIELITQEPHALGSLQYWSQNRYWINQELLYEMGGLFLKQNEGVSIMLIPSLAVTPVNTTGIPNIEVSLVDIAITDTNDVSGSKSAQIFAKVDSVQKNVLLNGTISKYLTADEDNAEYLLIRFKPDLTGDRGRRSATTKLWKRAFDQIAVVTQKTMSERGIIGYPVDESMKTYYIDDISRSDDETLSANLLIGYSIGTAGGIMNADYSGSGSAQTFLDDISSLRTEPTLQSHPFKFSYSKARVSLVMQSGAL